jgi:hypothetical protein
MNELDLLTGNMLYGWLLINDPVNRFSGIKLKDSPMGKECEKLLKELKLANNIPL